MATTRRGEDPEPVSVSSRRKEVIEDSEEEEDDEVPLDSGQTLPSDNDGLEDQERGSAGTERSDIDAQFDELFPPTPGRSKRRRVSGDLDTSVQRRGRTSDADPILSSSPEPPSPSSGHSRSSTPLPNPILNRTTTPAPRRNEAAFETPRPAPPSSTTKTPFRSHPRFVFSASQSSSRPPPRPRFLAESSTPAAATQSSVQQRKKPAFVLPRSPSPSRAAEDPASLATPFSPSVRRGRSRRKTPEYLPGGMAAEVRSWILEMAVKRENLRQQQQQQHRPQPDSDNQEATQPDTGRYFLTAEVETSRQAPLHGPGSVSFVRARPVRTESSRETSPPPREEKKNILLFGSPASQQGVSSRASSDAATNAPELNPNNVIGIHRGLVWEIELGTEPSRREERGDSSADHGHEGEDIPSACPQQDHAKEGKTEKWLVGMEWDLLR